MRYGGLILNDITAAPGLCVSFFTQGCPHRCKGCHNPESWNFTDGLEFTPEVLEQIIEGLTAQGIQRNLCIMGGEPLCAENAFLTYLVIYEVRRRVPDAKIYVWTGYIYEQIKELPPHDKVTTILDNIDFLIDGPFIQELRDTTLEMRGSSNQRIIDLSKKL